MENDRLVRKASTLFHQAQMDANEDRGGRYRNLTRPSVIGSSPIPIYPTQPGSSPSNQSMLVPPELPIDGTGEGNTLGYALGEPHEQSKASSPARDDAQGPVQAVEVNREHRPSWRRI
jgi:hypothetical protein